MCKIYNDFAIFCELMNFRIQMRMRNFLSMHISHISKTITKFCTCLVNTQIFEFMFCASFVHLAIWHLTSFRPFWYQTSSVFRSPLHLDPNCIRKLGLLTNFSQNGESDKDFVFSSENVVHFRWCKVFPVQVTLFVS